VSTDVGFVTAKYFGVLATILESIVGIDSKPHQTTLAIPAMLELGCRDKTALTLSSACIPRAAVLRVAPMIPKDIDDPVQWLSDNRNDSRVLSLPPIFRKILIRAGIWEADLEGGDGSAHQVAIDSRD
jgi:hypothetical protein